MNTSSQQEKKGLLKALRDQFRSNKEPAETREFYKTAAEHAKTLGAPVISKKDIDHSEGTVRKAFVKMANAEFPNMGKPGKVFDRMAFFATHEAEFGKNSRPAVKDYPEERLTATEVEEMNTTYNFSQTYERNGVYKELGSKEKIAGYRTALMGTGQIMGYCASEKFQKVARAVMDVKQQSNSKRDKLNANSAIAAKAMANHAH